MVASFHGLATKIPAALERIQQGSVAVEVLQQDLGLPMFRALLVARLLSISKPALYDLNQRDVGDFAELGLWLLLGLPPAQARVMVGRQPFNAGVCE